MAQLQKCANGTEDVGDARGQGAAAESGVDPALESLRVGIVGQVKEAALLGAVRTEIVGCLERRVLEERNVADKGNAAMRIGELEALVAETEQRIAELEAAQEETSLDQQASDAVGVMCKLQEQKLQEQSRVAELEAVQQMIVGELEAAQDIIGELETERDELALDVEALEVAKKVTRMENDSTIAELEAARDKLSMSDASVICQLAALEVQIEQDSINAERAASAMHQELTTLADQSSQDGVSTFTMDTEEQHRYRAAAGERKAELEALLVEKGRTVADLEQALDELALDQEHAWTEFMLDQQASDAVGVMGKVREQSRVAELEASRMEMVGELEASQERLGEVEAARDELALDVEALKAASMMGQVQRDSSVVVNTAMSDSGAAAEREHVAQQNVLEAQATRIAQLEQQCKEAPNAQTTLQLKQATAHVTELQQQLQGYEAAGAIHRPTAEQDGPTVQQLEETVSVANSKIGELEGLVDEREQRIAELEAAQRDLGMDMERMYEQLMSGQHAHSDLAELDQAEALLAQREEQLKTARAAIHTPGFAARTSAEGHVGDLEGQLRDAKQGQHAPGSPEGLSVEDRIQELESQLQHAEEHLLLLQLQGEGACAEGRIEQLEAQLQEACTEGKACKGRVEELESQLRAAEEHVRLAQEQVQWLSGRQPPGPHATPGPQNEQQTPSDQSQESTDGELRVLNASLVSTFSQISAEGENTPTGGNDAVEELQARLNHVGEQLQTCRYSHQQAEAEVAELKAQVKRAKEQMQQQLQQQRQTLSMNMGRIEELETQMRKAHEQALTPLEIRAEQQQQHTSENEELAQQLRSAAEELLKGTVQIEQLKTQLLQGSIRISELESLLRRAEEKLLQQQQLLELGGSTNQARIEELESQLQRAEETLWTRISLLQQQLQQQYQGSSVWQVRIGDLKVRLRNAEEQLA